MELALIAPLLIALALLVVAFGRVTAARGLIDQTAAQAARAASLARTPQQADGEARDTTGALLGSRHLTCRGMQVRTEGLRPGGTVHATITCTTTLGDLTGLWLPGEHTLTATAASVVDTYRSEPGGFAKPEGLSSGNPSGVSPRD